MAPVATSIIYALCGMGCIPSVSGHAKLFFPVPRTGPVSGIGPKISGFETTLDIVNEQKGGDGCGGRANRDMGQGDAPTVAFKPGDTIDVQWDTTIPHGTDSVNNGVRIAVKYTDDDSYTKNTLAGSLGGNGLAGTAGTRVAAGTTSGKKTHKVTLPAGKTCSCCTLQWVWAAKNDGGFYVGCVDIAITTDGTLPTSCAPLGMTMPPNPTPPVTEPTLDNTHVVALGRDGSGAQCRNNDEEREVRCCRDTAGAGWHKLRSTCKVYAQTYFSDENPRCIAGKSFTAAKAFCEKKGGRLCTASEVSNQCPRGTGCGFDRRLIWTSDVCSQAQVSARSTIMAAATMPAGADIVFGGTTPGCVAMGAGMCDQPIEGQAACDESPTDCGQGTGPYVAPNGTAAAGVVTSPAHLQAVMSMVSIVFVVGLHT